MITLILLKEISGTGFKSLDVFPINKKKLKQETQYKPYSHFSSKAHSYTYKHTHFINHASELVKIHVRHVDKMKEKIRIPLWHGQ